MSEEVPHTVLIRVEVPAETDAHAIVRAEQMVNDHPSDTKVVSFQYIGLAETPESRQAEDELARISLLDLIKRELVQRGYEEVEPGGSGVWTHPEWDGATDHIFPAIQDCFEREA